MKVAAFIICVPLIGTMFVKPDRDAWKKNDTSVTDESFAVRADGKTGSFLYSPERLTELLMHRMIPGELSFSPSEDYIEGADTAQDPEQEYLKALAIVCRSNMICIWEGEGCPAVLDYDRLQFGMADFSGIPYDEGTKSREIKNAVSATTGAVITKENRVITAPFFTTSPSDMFVGEAGDGVGFSLNYAYVLAKQGMDFYEILKYFFDDIKINLYE